MSLIDPRDVALLSRLRRFIEGGSATAPETGGARVQSPQKARLGRVIPVRWTLPLVDQNGILIPRNPLGPERFGRVEWMPDEPNQLDEEDWLVQAQPLNVLLRDRALPRTGRAPGVEPFISRTIGLSPALNPACWWPYDGTFDGRTPCDVLGSPFWLIVEGGPEAGTLQRIPIPIVGTTVAVRGRNVSASIEYDPGFAALGSVTTPLEQPVLQEGAGQILVTITKAQPVTSIVCDQLRLGQFRPPGGPTIDFESLVWIPKMTRRVVSAPQSFNNVNFIDQSGNTIAGALDFSFIMSVPHNAVAMRLAPGDYTPEPIPVAFEVFS